MTAVSTDAEEQRQAVEPGRDEFTDDWKQMKSYAKRVVVVQQTGALAVARLLLNQTGRVDGDAIESWRRKPCSIQQASMMMMMMKLPILPCAEKLES